MNNTNINDRHTVQIFDYCADGAGVARLGNGCVVFVEKAVRGDICEIIITKILKNVCHAVIGKIIKPSEHRIAVDCPYYDSGEAGASDSATRLCGGCDFRHVSYGEELFAKRKRVNDALRRIGGTDIEAGDILTTGKIIGYRNNIQLKTDGKNIGFYSGKSHDIINIDYCFLAGEEMNKEIKQGVSRIRTSVEKIGDLTFKISPESFFQVNSEAALLLYEKAREYADLKPHEFLLDLYCGTGSTTLFLARNAGRALGVELSAAAVADAKENAALNNIGNVDFLCADVSLLETGGLAPDCIVIDPPRKGLAPGALKKTEELAPARIIYISCNPATLARDIKLLHNYEVKQISAVDMFPRTKHIECVAKLERKKGAL
ncbi:MAG: 23S rRNA (uracil(1939)-C(5))-methyltransferase RlmD [Oscillospiraceae bacterium]|nr:23S rRNA (uracil(1939)-C(5))-methyltransferase RlmD [Oscillospiraceae bacterium]